MKVDTTRWIEGDIVSLTETGVVGKVVVLQRQSDGARYVKIQIVSGGPAGKWEWPDRWILGVGAFARVCLQCQQPFRTPLGGEEFCPACTRDERPNSTVPETRSIHGSLYGARTPRKPTPSAAAVTEPAPFETPFD